MPGSAVEATVHLPSADPGHGDPKILWFAGGDGVSVEVASRSVAAEVLAAICADQPVPGDGSVVLGEWAEALAPLRRHHRGAAAGAGGGLAQPSARMRSCPAPSPRPSTSTSKLLRCSAAAGVTGAG